MFKTYINYEGYHPIVAVTDRPKPGEQWSGDGVEFRCAFVAENKKDVELWLKGVKAMQKLLRATLTKGK